MRKSGKVWPSDEERVDFFKACAEGDATYVKAFLRDYPRAIDIRQPDDGKNGLMLACENNQEAVAVLVLKYMRRGKQANPNGRDHHNNTALIHTAKHGNPRITQALLQTSANVHLHDSLHQTALHHAASNGHEGMVMMLLDSGAVYDACAWGGFTPIDRARKSGHEWLANALENEPLRKSLRAIWRDVQVFHTGTQAAINAPPRLSLTPRRAP